MAHRRLPKLRRRGATRAPKRRFILFCEGGKTEPSYFGAIKRSCAQALVDIEPVPAVGVPMTVARKASERSATLGLNGKKRRNLDSYEEKDEVWAVFDRDEHPDFDKAVHLCTKNRVGVARSNPCFEVWLILHKAEYDRPDDRHKVQGRLAKLCPEYDPQRGKVPDCDELLKLIEQAESRAESQLKRRMQEGAPFGNPSTTVFRLTRAIRIAAGLVARKGKKVSNRKV